VQLTRLAEDYDKIKGVGADLITISADDQNFAWSMAQTTGAAFQILSDADRRVIKSYGVLNDKERDGIAHPSAFIVGKDGIIKYAYVGRNPTDRPPDETLLEEVKKAVK
jgi:peroxiredoxin Q/BCP